ncbi:MAG: cation transporter [Deferribacterota bacterium]|nr:cation transporter [Deferribacterota bacterium]
MKEIKKANLYKRGLSLEYFTVGYNIFEGFISIGAGIIAGSIALVGFGLDSFIETLSGVVLIWRLRGHSEDDEKERAMEQKAMRFVAYTFFILAIYVLYEASKKLYFREIPEGSLVGIIIALLSIIIMPILASQKRIIGEKINSGALIADSKETVFCAYLSVTLLLGLLLNYFFGWWWADPAASLVIVGFLIKEGLECLEGDEDHP